METLVDKQGRIPWGIYADPVGQVNYLDYDLRTPMGIALPRMAKRILAHQFHFLGIIGDEIIGGLAVVDLKFLANGFFYLYDRHAKCLTETSTLAPSTARVGIAPFPEQPASAFSAGGLEIEIRRSRVTARAKRLSLDLHLDATATSPLRICTRAGYRGWVYTQKTTPVRVCGTAILEDRQFDISSPSTMALTDWTCGYMRRKTCWNWAAIAGTLPDGRSLGLNCSCGVNETSFTENAFWIDGAMTKVDTVDFIFDRDDLLRPWRIRSFDGKVDLSFSPEAARGEKINAVVVASRFQQLMGRFTGILRPDSGEIVRIEDCPGLAEDHYAKW